MPVVTKHLIDTREWGRGQRDELVGPHPRKREVDLSGDKLRIAFGGRGTYDRIEMDVADLREALDTLGV